MSKYSISRSEKFQERWITEKVTNSGNTVSRIVVRYQETGNVLDLPRYGRPKMNGDAKLNQQFLWQFDSWTIFISTNVNSFWPNLSVPRYQLRHLRCKMGHRRIMVYKTIFMGRQIGRPGPPEWLSRFPDLIPVVCVILFILVFSWLWKSRVYVNSPEKLQLMGRIRQEANAGTLEMIQNAVNASSRPLSNFKRWKFSLREIHVYLFLFIDGRMPRPILN